MLGHVSCRPSVPARCLRATASASCGPVELQQQVDQHLGGVGADLLRVGLVGLLAEVGQPLLDRRRRPGSTGRPRSRRSRCRTAASSSPMKRPRQLLAVVAQLAGHAQLRARLQAACSSARRWTGATCRCGSRPRRTASRGRRSAWRARRACRAGRRRRRARSRSGSRSRRPAGARSSSYSARTSARMQYCLSSSPCGSSPLPTVVMALHMP